jgi:Golgi SNAP receptor complex protein 1
VSSFRTLKVFDCANLANRACGVRASSLGWAALAPTCRHRSWRRVASSREAPTTVYNSPASEISGNKTCPRPAEDGRNCANKHVHSRARSDIHSHGLIGHHQLTRDADGVAIPHLFTVCQRYKHPHKTVGRGSTDGLAAARDTRKGSFTLPWSRPNTYLLQREALVGQLSRLLDSESAHSSSAVKQNNLARHREILADHRRDLSRLKSTITDARNKANLLSNVRSDIDAYRSANPETAEAEYMLDERRRIDNSHSMADNVLSQAYAVNDNFRIQRETLSSINRRIVGAASQVPGINSLIGRIGAKKRRDGIVLGSFIAFCFLMLLWFW